MIVGDFQVCVQREMVQIRKIIWEEGSNIISLDKLWDLLPVLI